MCKTISFWAFEGFNLFLNLIIIYDAYEKNLSSLADVNLKVNKYFAKTYKLGN